MSSHETTWTNAETIWEQVYQAGRQRNRWPWDAVVSFLHYAERRLDKTELRVLEVGCGTGSNLLAAQQRGHVVAGLDASPTAISLAREALNLRESSEIVVGDFADLPWPDGSFDVIIDRAALTTAPPSSLVLALAEARRCLRLGGLLYFNPYSLSHGAARFAQPTEIEGVHHLAKAPSGYLRDLGDVSFLDPHSVTALLPDSAWRILSIREVQSHELAIQNAFRESETLEAEIRIVAEKLRPGAIESQQLDVGQTPSC